MGKTAFRYLCALLAILFASCSKEGPLDKMEHIKMVGNDHPKQALAMLDSLEQEARRGSVYAQKKYDLLHIRLSDKANILPKSDAKIKELVEYFGKKGSDQEKQEVYYYAGSVYRDLQDCPRALEYFYKSTDFAIGHPDCDSIMLRNTYSNLNFLQYRVQNYKEALAMSKEELRSPRNSARKTLWTTCTWEQPTRPQATRRKPSRSMTKRFISPTLPRTNRRTRSPIYAC